MEGGNEATNGSGITQFAEGEPKCWNYQPSLIFLIVVLGSTNVMFA